MADPSATLAALLTSSPVDEKAVITQANKILKTDKTNEKALKAKAVALLKLDRFIEAVDTLKPHQVPSTAFELAYALWKVGRYDEAEAVIGSATPKDARTKRALSHVLAQTVGFIIISSYSTPTDGM